MYRSATIVAILALAGAARAEDDPLKQALALEASVQKVVENAEASVACILVSRSEAYFDKPFNLTPPDKTKRGELGGFQPSPADINQKTELLKRLNLAEPEAVPDSYGSGVVVGPGLILTNQHVIRDATKIYVRLPGIGGSYANIKTSDERSDLAVLELIRAPAGMKPLPMGDGAAAKKGQFVISLANPWAAGFRDGSPSVAWGMLSNVRRRLPGEPNEGEKRRPRIVYYPVLFQTNLNVAPGASGGALLDLKGNWIGLLTALPGVAGGEGSGGYAVPLDTRMKRIIDKLKKGEEVEYGFLGISQPRDSRQWSPTEGGPAHRAGMQESDEIVAIDGAPINDNEDLLFNITTSLAGTQIRLTVKRANGRRQDLFPTLAKTNWPGYGPVIAANRPAPVYGLRVDYVTVAYPGLRDFGNKKAIIPQGVVVREVEDGSPAAKAQLQPDKDIISTLNGTTVNTPKEFYLLARDARGPVELNIIDGEGRNVRKVKLP